MFDLRHKIAKGRLYVTWEPEWLFLVLPGVMFMWGALVAMHRLASRGTDASSAMIFVCCAVLFAAGVCLSCGRAGLVFDPAARRWGWWLGIIKPLYVHWRPIADGQKLVLKVDELTDQEQVYTLAFEGKQETKLGVTYHRLVAFSMSESLAAFLRCPLAVKTDRSEKVLADGPVWGQIGACFGKPFKADKKALKEKAIKLASHVNTLAGRGPFFLSAFMVFIVCLSWRSEALWRSLWGLAAVGAVGIGFILALLFALAMMGRKISVSFTKQQLAVDWTFPGRKSWTFPWEALAYLTVVPARKGFLPVAGRDAAIVVGLKDQDSVAFGECLNEDNLVGLYNNLLQQASKQVK